MSSSSSSRKWSRIFKLDARAEVEDELAFHLEQRTQANIARGMDPETARLAAQQRLGDLKSIERECTMLLQAERRAEARSHFMKMSWLDFRLGFRMLIKFPGLTIVGGLAIALAIAVGSLAFEFGAQIIRPTVPLPNGDRLVGLRLWHLPSNGVEEQALYDYQIWRDKLETVEELGAFRDTKRNLVTREGQSTPIRVAEISPSAFRLGGTRPLLGRPLVESDEQPGAEAVLVLGERLWKQMFDSDPTVVGQVVRLGRSQATVVGVMPEKFGFPLNHTAWAPLNLRALDSRPREGSPIRVFGRLAEDVSLEQAQAELDVLGAQISREQPQTHEHIRPQIMPYTRSFFPMAWGLITGMALTTQLGVILFLVLVCANVATLVFARTATRENEIVVRNSLGASRGRIITQLLAETLVLGALAAVIGLSVASFGVRLAVSLFQTEVTQILPFWINERLSPLTILYAVFLTILAAVVAGVIPALKVTRGLAQRLRQAAVGGVNLRFGRLWTGLIVTQVALTVIFMGMTLDTQRDASRAKDMRMGFRANEFLAAQLEMDRDVAATEAAEVPYTKEEFARFRASFEEVHQRLLRDPGVTAVTYAQSLPGMYHDRQRIEVEGVAAPPASGTGHVAFVAFVGVNFFETMGVDLVGGRWFQSGDLDTSAAVDRPTGSSLPRSRAIVVNQTFARRVFGGASPVGRRIRYVFCEDGNCRSDRRLQADRSGRINEWYEIIGVVKDIAMTGDPDLLRTPLGGMYHPWAPGDIYAARMAVHVRGDPDVFAARFRQIATEADPSLRVTYAAALDDMFNQSLRPYDIGFRVALIISAVVLLLSVAGTYSIMAFTVSRRTREIGIRAALGGNPGSILWAVFSRAILQVTIGAALGGVLMLALMGGIKSGYGLVILLVPITIMLGICGLACIVPTRRALRIQPTQALSAGG